MNFKFSDSVCFRMIQIFQEAMLLGVDGADLFRQVRLCITDASDDTLELAPEYVQQVKDMHAKLLADAEALQAASDSESTGKILVQ